MFVEFAFQEDMLEQVHNYFCEEPADDSEEPCQSHFFFIKSIVQHFHDAVCKNIRAEDDFSKFAPFLSNI